MNKKEKIARIIRVITIPPILVSAMIVILYWKSRYFFGGVSDYVISLIGLGIFPVLAYPIQFMIPKLKEKGREGQRNLAFIGSVIGYFLAFLYGEMIGASAELRFIYRTYLIAVLLLVFMNKVLKKRASGHACSIMAPLLFLSYFVGWKVCIGCILIAASSFWASLVLKRHKASDLIAGSLVCIISFGIAYWITMI